MTLAEHAAADSIARSAPKAADNYVSRREVFFDPTGRRWQLTKFCALLLLLFVLFALASCERIQRPPTITTAGQALPLPHTIPANGLGYMPEIGTGPLVRVVRLAWSQGQYVAVDPFTNCILGEVTGDDAETASGAYLALQRYGYSSAAHKTIALTFDDGPDPTWMPKILDLLSRYKVPATFFVIGSEVAKFPDIVAREAREGHAVGNHTLTHPPLTVEQVGMQFGLTDRIICATTGIRTSLVRLPYDGNSGSKANGDLGEVIIATERLKYIISMDEFDPSDWMYGAPALRPKTPMPLPPSTMDDITILLHDGGGNRAHTVAYLNRLIPWAYEHGYRFATLPQISPDVQAVMSRGAASFWNSETLWGAEAIWSWPNDLIQLLFFVSCSSWQSPRSRPSRVWTWRSPWAAVYADREGSPGCRRNSAALKCPR